MNIPHNIEAERALLHQLIFERGQNISQVLATGIDSGCFHDPKHSAIFEAIESIHREGRNPDMISVSEWLASSRHKNVEPYDVTQLMSVEVNSESGYIASILLHYHMRRQAIMLCQQAAHSLNEGTESAEDIIASTAEKLEKIASSKTLSPTTTLNDATNIVLQQMEDNLDPSRRHHGSLTGFSQIDDTGGLPEVGVTVIAADTGQGKSSLGIDLAMQNLRNGEKVGYFTLEMPPEDLTRRIIAADSGIPAYRIAYHQLNQEEQKRVRDSALRLFTNGGNRFFFDSQMETSIEQICNGIHRLADPKGLRVTHFYIDYMQILSWASDNARSRTMTVEQILANAARMLHNISVKMKVQVVLLSQVNRDSDCRELTLDRIRDSKQIADAATCVILLYRPEAYGKNYQSERFHDVDPTGTALINVAKRRNGPCCQFICGFDSSRTHFYPLDTLPRISNSSTSSPLRL